MGGGARGRVRVLACVRCVLGVFGKIRDVERLDFSNIVTQLMEGDAIFWIQLKDALEDCIRL